MKNNINLEHSENVLISLGLKPKYILKYNHLFFGKEDLYNQKVIEKKFNIIEVEYETFLEKIIKKYEIEKLLYQLGTLYTKLQSITLNNDEILIKENLIDNIDDISYSARCAEIMGRTTKSIIEKTIIRNDKKRSIIIFKKDFRKLIILLYYYSLYKFYSSRTKLSKDYENGITEFIIFPNDLNCIITRIKNTNNKNDTKVRYNYEPNTGLKIDDVFNEAFLKEKGIQYKDFLNLMDSLLEWLNAKHKNNERLNIKIIENLKKTYPSIDLEKFKNHCILTKNSFEYEEEYLYKNSCKYRLDTTPIIDIGKNYYIINKGLIWNSRNFWNNVQFLGLKPYTLGADDNILMSVEKIVKRISLLFEKDIIETFKNIFKEIDIYHNRKTKHIFKNRKLEDNEWDIIIVEHSKKYIFDIEAKFITTSMTASTSSNDLIHFVGPSKKSYQNKFQKRINIEKENRDEFLHFCKANESYKIIHIMVTSKIVDLDVESINREFLIISFKDLKQFIIKQYL